MKEDLRPNYLKIKLMELLYLLKHIDRKSGSAAQTLVPRLQVEFVQRVADYITKNINDKITVKYILDLIKNIVSSKSGADYKYTWAGLPEELRQ